MFSTRSFFASVVGGGRILLEQAEANPKKLPARPPDLPTYPKGGR
jgi:hypothetical protein